MRSGREKGAGVRRGRGVGGKPIESTRITFHGIITYHGAVNTVQKE